MTGFKLSTKPFALISLGHTVSIPVFGYCNRGPLILTLNFDNTTAAHHATHDNDETVIASIVDVIP